MAALLPVALVVVFFVVFALSFGEGLWSNVVLLFNVVTAALLAMNFFEPLATLVEENVPSIAYFADFLAMWLVFLVAIIVFRMATDSVSKVRVRFRKPVDTAGGALFAGWVAWILVSFTLTSLHVAPIERSGFGGAFQEAPDSKMFFGLAPDRKWLAFVYSMSRGGSIDRVDPAAPEFNADFILRYGNRRAEIEKADSFLK